MKGLQEGADGFSDGNEFFSQWFPFTNIGGGHGREGRGKASQIVIRLEVTLEEVYNGNVAKTVEYKRTSYCSQCHGEGGPKEAQEKCSHCNGLGRTASYAFMGLTAVETVRWMNNSLTFINNTFFPHRSARRVMDMAMLYPKISDAFHAKEKVWSRKMLNAKL